MQKFDEVFEILEDLEILTRDLDEVLALERRLTSKELSEVADLYRKRKVLLNEIDELFESEDFRKYLSDKSDLWDTKIKGILEIDAKNMNRLQNKAKELNFEIKEIVKRKSLLIYSKGR